MFTQNLVFVVCYLGGSVLVFFALRGLFLCFGGFWPSCMACGILAPDREPVPSVLPVVETGSLNHWASREVPEFSFAIICHHADPLMFHLLQMSGCS